MNNRESDYSPINGWNFEFRLPSGTKAKGQECPVCGCPSALMILTSVCCANSTCQWFNEDWEKGLGPSARDAIRLWKRKARE